MLLSQDASAEEKVVWEKVVACASSLGNEESTATFAQVATEEIAEVLAWRKDAARQAGLPLDVVVVPFRLQKQIQARHYRRWVEGLQQAEEVSRRKWAASDTMNVHNHSVDRYRSWCHDRFGGLEWLYVLIALGDRDELATKCMKEALEQKQPEQAAGEVSAASWGSNPQVALPPGEQNCTVLSGASGTREASVAGRQASVASRGKLTNVDLRGPLLESPASPGTWSMLKQVIQGGPAGEMLAFFEEAEDRD